MAAAAFALFLPRPVFVPLGGERVVEVLHENEADASDVPEARFLDCSAAGRSRHHAGEKILTEEGAD
jgi:hypothetical protein